MLSSPRVFRRILLVFASFTLLSVQAAAQESNFDTRTTPAIVETDLAVLNGNTHPLARPEFDRGAAPPTLSLNRMLLVLKRTPEQEVALKALLDQQQNKASSNYHAWLTSKQFGQQYGPTDQDIQSITSWLTSHGFEVDRVANGCTVVVNRVRVRCDIGFCS